MPKITSSADLRNNYNEISNFCHQYKEPVFITKNGKGDLAVMSIEAYEELTARFELYGALKQGLDDIEAGRTMSAGEFLAELEAKKFRQ
ncbi:type II toxin-antitoxin system prevent-host-death family antitoxin [Phascolarctobacterium succinatutens]|uniref:type II toxin-antitoxin system prevent-host-death family antitoxin n=1 Tax=Phascolarctobacterium succinatutens TaxID=626940 RepID=UPI0026EBBB2B|nr:type II toxin-antitoxin system prevent-host-death family antitoxin [Phascolarctobacterium succinatutens]